MRSFASALGPNSLVPLAALALAGFLLAPGHAQGPAAPGIPAFHQLDANGDGRVTLEEVLASATQRHGQAKAFALKDVDANGDGLITQEELGRAGIKGLEGLGSIRARDLDVNGDGYVSHEDLQNYLNTKHREAYAMADQDRDGSLRPSEFVLFRFK